MTLTVNGVDLTPYTLFQGVEWSRNDIDGENAGRSITGDMIRDRVAVKMKLQCKCRPLTSDEARIVLQSIAPEYVTVSYTDPQLGARSNVKMYSNNVPATYCMRRDGVDWWMGIAFPLIEV